MKRILLLVVLMCLAGCAKKEQVVNPPPAVTAQADRAFLSIPFPRGTNFRVLHGWLYSPREQSIYRTTNHKAIDFAAPRETPVLAAADGFALATYQSEPGGYYKGKRLGHGLGYFVQIWHQERRVFTTYGHLSRVAKDVPYYEPEIHGDYIEPTIVYMTGEQVLSVQTKIVHRGDVIGFVGDTGCYWGYKEKPGYRPDPKQYPSIDGPNLHFQVFTRGPNGKIDYWLDPYGIYGQAAEYQGNVFADGYLWLTGKTKPLFADEPMP